MRGTRVLVSAVLDNLADGQTSHEILRLYPTLCPEDLTSTIAYAADLGRQRLKVPASDG
jgi:uncharacterized protein (DUF433 family)